MINIEINFDRFGHPDLILYDLSLLLDNLIYLYQYATEYLQLDFTFNNCTMLLTFELRNVNTNNWRQIASIYS